MSSTVKPPRRYDSSGRRKQAERTRAAILAAARTMFFAGGYAATTVPSIAREAGVSVETVYKAIGPKPALVRAVWEQGLAGTGPVSAERRSEQLSATESDAAAIVRGWGALMREVAPLTAPILLLIRDASAADPDMATLLAETESQRRIRMSENARRLTATGQLRPDVHPNRVTDILWCYSAPELYELLVLKAGWTVEAYCDFAAESMIGALVAR